MSKSLAKGRNVMEYKLINVINKAEENVWFGTCELCEYMGTHHYDVLVFENEQGKQFEIENGYWCWGDYFVRWPIDNYVKFADFIQGRDYPCADLVTTMFEVVNQMWRDYENSSQQ